MIFLQAGMVAPIIAAILILCALVSSLVVQLTASCIQRYYYQSLSESLKPFWISLIISFTAIASILLNAVLMGKDII